MPEALFTRSLASLLFRKRVRTAEKEKERDKAIHLDETFQLLAASPLFVLLATLSCWVYPCCVVIIIVVVLVSAF